MGWIWKFFILSQSNYLKKWHAKLLAMSHADQQRRLMEYFSTLYTPVQAIEMSRQIDWLNKSYEVQLIPINETTDMQNTMTLVISDISDEMAAIDAMVLKTFNAPS